MPLGIEKENPVMVKVDRKIHQTGRWLFAICLLNIGEVGFLALISTNGYRSGTNADVYK
jgi:hypothetical protein